MKLPCVISLVSFSFVAVFARWAAQAQLSTASVSGTVRDKSGSDSRRRGCFAQHGE